jgi:hypothetical protein
MAPAYPKVVPSIDIPLDNVSFSFRCKRLETMVVSDATSLIVRLLLVVLVMAMVGVEDVSELAHLVLYMGGFDERLLETAARKLALDLLDFLTGLVVEGVEELGFQAALPRTFRHVWAVRLQNVLEGLGAAVSEAWRGWR